MRSSLLLVHRFLHMSYIQEKANIVLFFFFLPRLLGNMLLRKQELCQIPGLSFIWKMLRQSPAFAIGLLLYLLCVMEQLIK